MDSQSNCISLHIYLASLSDAFSSGNTNQFDQQNESNDTTIDQHDLYSKLLPDPKPIREKNYNEKLSINSAFKIYPKQSSILQQFFSDIDLSRNYQSVPEDQLDHSDQDNDQYKNQLNKSLELFEYCENMKLVYQKYIPDYHRKYYSTYFYNLRKSNNQESQLGIQKSQNQASLIFDSKFENGNLFQVFEKSNKCYDMILQNDINTKGYTQWFYFSVDNCPIGDTVEFNIVNMASKFCIMRTIQQSKNRKYLSYVYYEQEWKKIITNIAYSKNNILKDGKEDKFYYTLSFKFTFKTKKVYFASNYPYTYQNLNSYLLSKLQSNPNIMVKRLLCNTIAMNDCDYITITSKYPNDQKKGVIFLARQHPGEVTGSFVAEGIIKYLLTDEAKELRDKYIFKIIPMMNVDGVIHGNQRCSLAGVDLNRKWLFPDYQIHPSIFYAKQLIKQFQDKYTIELLVDLHSHSKKLNSKSLSIYFRLGAFFYGNRNIKGSEIYPSIVGQLNSQIDLANNRFINLDIQKLKSTARATLGRLLNISNVYTLECSHVGYMKNNKLCPFTVQDYRNLGVSMCQALNKDKRNIKITEIQCSSMNLIDSASDSNPSEDEIDPKILFQRKNRLSQSRNQKRRERISLSDCKNWHSNKCRPQTQSQETNTIKTCQKRHKIAYNFVEKQQQKQIQIEPKQRQTSFSTCNNSIYLRKKKQIKICEFDDQQHFELPVRKEQMKLNTILLQEYPSLLENCRNMRKRNTFRKIDNSISYPQKETFSFQQKKVPLMPIINL